VISRQDRVQVWASQLAANDFPPVCAMTGAPAQTWRKFRFSSPPQWAYALYVLVILGLIGMIVAAVVMSAVSQRASGYLPLTRGSRRLVGLALWVPIGLMVGAVVLWTIVPIGAAANVDAGDTNAGGVAGIVLLVGALLLVAGLIGRLVVTPLVCPRARVIVQPGYYDKLVEIRNVHPAFVAAVNQVQQARAAHYAAMSAQANPPPLQPGSI
jgi:hypothetical protein